MRNIRTISILLFLIALCLDMSAQSIVCKKQGKTEDPSLDKNIASVTFVSRIGDWVIKPLDGNVPPLQGRRAADGKGYEFEFKVDVSTNNECSFVIARKGSPQNIQQVAKGLYGRVRVTYSLDEEADTLMRIEAQRDSKIGSYPKKDMACVDITTTLNALSVHTPWPLQEEKTVSGARSILVTVDITRMEGMRNALDSLTMLMRSKEKADDNAAVADLRAKRDEAQAEYDKYSEVTLEGKGIKPVTIEIEDLSKKERRRYVVIALTESFDDLLAHARSLRDAIPQHIDNGHYDATRIAYDKALEHKDAPPAQLEAIRAERNEVAALRKLIWLMWRAGELADAAEKKEGATCEQVYKNVLAQYNICKKLVDEHPEIEGVPPVRDAAYERLKKHPMFFNKTEVVETHQRQVLSGKVVKGNGFLLTIPGLRVYSVSHGGKIKGSDYKKEIGRIKPDGTFRIVLENSTDYIYIEGEKEARPISASTSDMGTLSLER